MIKRRGRRPLASSVFCRPCCGSHELCAHLTLCNPCYRVISGMPTVSWLGRPEPGAQGARGFLSALRPCVVLVHEAMQPVLSWSLSVFLVDRFYPWC